MALLSTTRSDCIFRADESLQKITIPTGGEGAGPTGGTRPEDWALGYGLERYLGSNVKGRAEIDIDNEKERRALLQEMIVECLVLVA